MCLIFVVEPTHENVLTTKISRITVVIYAILILRFEIKEQELQAQQEKMKVEEKR